MVTSIVVQTLYGEVMGIQRDDICLWRGIPYAQPPVGPLRFRPPEPPEPWAALLDATQFGARCPQPVTAFTRFIRRASSATADMAAEDEDCLTLNIWSRGADAGRRPVLVWLHGGAFISGSGDLPWYDGTSFARHDVVVVTLNYRLGPLGYLHLGDIGGDAWASAGNCGLLDQIAALRWVRENIAAFGGDPQNVTVFGESAGAMSIGALLGAPAARGLFARAILQSGAASSVLSRDRATQNACDVLAALEIAPDDLAALRDVPARRLVAAAQQVNASGRAGGLLFGPVIDGAVLPETPLAAIANGAAEGVALLIGTNAEEMNLFTVLDPRLAEMSAEDVQRRCAALGGAEAASRVLLAYRQAYPGASPAQLWSAISTAAAFRMPAQRLAEAQLRHNASVWMYRFDWRSPALDGRLGACHTLELPFVWNTLEAPAAGFLTGDAPDQHALAKHMHTAWLAFAHTGTPVAPSLPTWPRYEGTRRATMLFDTPCRLAEDPDAAERRLWEGVL